MEYCRCCGDAVRDSNRKFWNFRDVSINLPLPPTDLVGAIICSKCYTDGDLMEARIRHRDKLLEASSNQTCGACNKKFEYKFAVSGFKWENGAPPVPKAPYDLKGTIICKPCWGIHGCNLEAVVRANKKLSVVEDKIDIVVQREDIDPFPKVMESKINYWNQPYPTMGHRIR